MAMVGNAATNALKSKLTAATGLPFAIAALAEQEKVDLPVIDETRIAAQHVAADVVERTAGAQYPAVYVYCEGMANTLKEKFRTFSGKVQMAIELRASHDRLEGVSQNLQLYTAAALEVLNSQRGDWGSGLFYTGGYKVEFGPIRRGGKNFLQTAKVSFDVEAST
jgi:hypothetical protein